MYLKSMVSHVSGRVKGAWASRVSYELLSDEEKAISDCRNKSSAIEEGYGNINRDNEVELVKRHSNGKQRGVENQTKIGQGNRRLASLDVFRGLTVAVWIFILSENLFLYGENAYIIFMEYLAFVGNFHFFALSVCVFVDLPSLLLLLFYRQEGKSQLRFVTFINNSSKFSQINC